MDRREILEELDRIVGTAGDEYLDRTRTVAELANLAARLYVDIGAEADGPARPHPSDSPLAPRTVTINEGELQALRKDAVDARAWRGMLLDVQAERDALRAEVDTLKAELSYAAAERDDSPVILGESRDYTRDQLDNLDGRDAADRLDSLEAAMGDVQDRLRLLGSTEHRIRGHLVDHFNRIRDVEAGIRLLTTECNTFRDQMRRAFRRLARHGGLRRWPRPG